MKRLPDLAFANAVTPPINCVDTAAAALSRVIPSSQFINAHDSARFLAKCATTRIGGIRLIAHSTMSCHIQVHGSDHWLLTVPYFGHGRMKFENHTVDLVGGVNAILLPNIPRQSHSSTRSTVTAHFDMDRLCATVAAMSGRDVDAITIEKRPHELDMRQPREIFPTFQRICALIDAVFGNQRFADLLGIEDMLYRWTAMAFGVPGTGAAWNKARTGTGTGSILSATWWFPGWKPRSP